jgi:outer membrane biosynthesis protein TonB
MKSPRMRVTVGTLLLGLGGCASSAKPQPDGGCEPPDCHINPGPQDATLRPEPKPEPRPEPKPEPQPEPQPELKPEPKPEPELEPKPAPTADPKLEPKRVNTGPTP